MVTKIKEYKNLKTRIFEIIEKADREDKISRIFDNTIIFLILINVLAIILESFQGIYQPYRIAFKSIEVISVIIFTGEYILRIWTANLRFKNKKRLLSRLRFIITPMAIIDLLAIMPFYLPMIMPFDLRVLRMLRITRLLRIFKLNRYSSALNILGKVAEKKKEELAVTVFITFVLLLLASTLMYHIEHESQPEAFPNIIASFWWAIATLTTVGYGDVYPITGWGRLLSGIIAILGIGLVALPTGIISSGFMEAIDSDKKEEDDFPKYCCHCGKEIKR